jgi:hypothetical protein
MDLENVFWLVEFRSPFIYALSDCASGYGIWGADALFEWVEFIILNFEQNFHSPNSGKGSCPKD